MSTSMDFDGFWGMVPFDEICTFIVPFVTTESEALKPRWLFCGGMQQAGRSFFFFSWFGWVGAAFLDARFLMFLLGLAFVVCSKWAAWEALAKKKRTACSKWLLDIPDSVHCALFGSRRRFRAAQGARAKRFAIAHGPAYSTVSWCIMCFVNFQHFSAHFIAFTTWCKAATIQGTVLQFAGMPAVKQSVSFWQLQGWNYWKGIIPRTWRLQTGLGGHNLDCGNM